MKLRRLVAAVIASTFALSSTAFAKLQVEDIQVVSFGENAPFSDVDINTDEGKAISVMYAKGYLKGYEDGTFKPSNGITRAELTRVFNQVFGYTLNESVASNMKDFTDNTEKEAWYYTDVRIAQSNGYINGFEDGSFLPKANFTREQTCTVIAKACNLENKEIAVEINDQVSQWAREYVNINLANGVFELENGGIFRAKENITRGEVCKALVKFVDGTIKVNKPSETTTVSAVETSTEITTTDKSATTENSTETTTKSSSTTAGGGGGGGGGGGSSSSSTVEQTTETTTITSPSDINMNEEQDEALARVIRQTKNEFIPRLYKSEHLAIANVILDTLNTYYNDRTYDFTNDINTAKSMYKAMSKDDQSVFKNTAISSYDMDDIQILMPIFEAFI
ncbi:MAG: S-layer homology domain-containing protein [Lachnospirales bacterium]